MAEKKKVRDWKFYGPETELGEISSSGKPFADNGFIGGLLCLYAWLPIPPGHINNFSSTKFPMKVEMVDGANQKRMHGNDSSLEDNILATAKQLEEEGCRFIGADCGYFGNFQGPISALVNIPCYLSSVIQVPWIRQGLRDDQKIGVICGDGPNLKFHLFDSCGIAQEDYDRCCIYGAQDKPIFSTFTELPGHADIEGVRDEIVDIAKQMVHDHPDIGAILIECTDMPPFSADVQAATNLPVYDVKTMHNFAARVTTRKRRYAFR